MDTRNYAIVMAGGVGSRFWPMSRRKRPKQFLDILGTGKTLIEQTVERLRGLCPLENILIVTNDIYRTTIAQLLPGLPAENILTEPMRRNTAPCIAYGAYKIQKRNPEARIVVVPSDQVITKEERFVRVVEKGFEFVSENPALLTLGIKPHRPETGYGYIEINRNNKIEGNEDYALYKVKQFSEKPNLERAKMYYQNGNYFWNAGMFIWTVQTIIKAFEEHLPEVDSLFKQNAGKFDTAAEVEAIKEIYNQSVAISIDYAVMEKASNVYSLCTEIGWSDIGTWGSLHEHLSIDEEGNSIRGKKVMMYNSENCIVKLPDNKVVVINGLQDYIVVEESNALLICPKSEEQNIKTFVTDTEEQFGDDFV